MRRVTLEVRLTAIERVPIAVPSARSAAGDDAPAASTPRHGSGDDARKGASAAVRRIIRQVLFASIVRRGESGSDTITKASAAVVSALSASTGGGVDARRGASARASTAVEGAAATQVHLTAVPWVPIAVGEGRDAALDDAARGVTLRDGVRQLAAIAAEAAMVIVND